MNKTKIEWCDYTWNPVIGCKNGCDYCYANKLHTMRHEAFKEGKDIPKCYSEPFSEVLLFKNRLTEVEKLKNPATIFVCSMSDLFAPWVPEAWIILILQVAKNNPQHTFKFLTKYPELYHSFKFTENCWLGTTIEEKSKLFRLQHLQYYNASPVKKFVSIEPIRSDFDGEEWKFIDEIYIGQETGCPPVFTEFGLKRIVASVNHSNVLLKDNLKIKAEDLNDI